MPCYKPLTAVNLGIRKDTGKQYIKILKKSGVHEWVEKQANLIKLPCGRCRGCRHERARQWAVRCFHEAQLHENNCFITLTYRPSSPIRGYPDITKTLVKDHFQKFLKRLRKYYFGNSKSNIKYFHCGEYGENFERPHHHACLFNFNFPDRKLYKTKEGNDLYTSQTLEDLWPYGYSSIGAVTYASAAYVARYIIKKINGDMAPAHYLGRTPEYTTMSRRPAIALDWFNKYKDTDVFPRDYTVVNGVKGKAPKYYDKIYELTNPDEFITLKAMRKAKAKANPNYHPDRLKAADLIQQSKDNLISRTYETTTN